MSPKCQGHGWRRYTGQYLTRHKLYHQRKIKFIQNKHSIAFSFLSKMINLHHFLAGLQKWWRINDVAWRSLHPGHVLLLLVQCDDGGAVAGVPRPAVLWSLRRGARSQEAGGVWGPHRPTTRWGSLWWPITIKSIWTCLKELQLKFSAVLMDGPTNFCLCICVSVGLFHCFGLYLGNVKYSYYQTETEGRDANKGGLVIYPPPSLLSGKMDMNCKISFWSSCRGASPDVNNLGIKQPGKLK